MTRKLTIIGVIIAIAAIVSYFLYLSRREPTQIEVVSGEPSQEVELLPASEITAPEAETSGLRIVAPIKALNYWIDAGDRTIYLATAEGVVYSTTPGGGEPVEIFRIPAVSGSAITDVRAGGAAAALVEYRSPENRSAFALIDPALRKTNFLPLGTIAAAWSSNGKEVAYFQIPQGVKDVLPVLFIYTPATNTSRRLASFELLDPVLSWPEGSDIILGTKASDMSEGVEWRYNIKAKTLTRSLPPTRGLTVKWSPAGTIGVRYTAVSSSLLEIINPAGKTLAAWSRATLPEKCALTSTAVICATPVDSPLPTRLRDVYLERASYTEDSIISVPISKNLPMPDKTSVLFKPEESSTVIDAYHLEKVGSSLYLLNRYDGFVYSLIAD